MFLTNEDYRVVCSDEDLEVISQSDGETLRRAERIARQEVSVYLGGRYDMKKAYAATGDDRNPLLVQTVATIALYYMIHWLPQSLGFESREEMYNNAVALLKNIQAGKGTIDLPTITGEGGEEDAANPIRYGGIPPNRYTW